MLHFVHGNLLESLAKGLINTVNCIGVMGAGLAKAFRSRYPANYEAYRRYCTEGKLHPGGLFLYEEEGRIIINLATKDHYRYNSNLTWIRTGLENLITILPVLREHHELTSLAIPPLGCGLGGLRWEEVRLLIVEYLSDIDMDIYVYEPKEEHHGI